VFCFSTVTMLGLSTVQGRHWTHAYQWRVLKCSVFVARISIFAIYTEYVLYKCFIAFRVSVRIYDACMYYVLSLSLMLTWPLQCKLWHFQRIIMMQAQLFFFFNIQEKDRCSAKKNTNIQRGEVVLRHFDQIVCGRWPWWPWSLWWMNEHWCDKMHAWFGSHGAACLLPPPQSALSTFVGRMRAVDADRHTNTTQIPHALTLYVSGAEISFRSLHSLSGIWHFDLLKIGMEAHVCEREAWRRLGTPSCVCQEDLLQS
jgi:hypothetical protein